MSSNGKVATADQLLSAVGRLKRRYREVHLPVSGLTVRIRSLSEGELSSYQRRMFAKGGRGLDPQGMASANRRLFVLCLVDGAGDRLLADSEADRLAEMDAADASVLYEACAEHCGVDRSDLGELVKNSEPTTGGSLPSASPTVSATST